MTLASIVGGFIIIILGTALMPGVAESVRRVDESWNGSDWISNASMDGASTAMVELTTIFFAIGILSAGIALVARGFKSAGIA